MLGLFLQILKMLATINPGILIIQPHAGSLKNKPASNVNSISPANMLPYKRRPSVNVEVNSSKH